MVLLVWVIFNFILPILGQNENRFNNNSLGSLSTRNCIKPAGSDWPGDYKNRRFEFLSDWLLTGCWNSSSSNIRESHTEYEGYDGWYNNLARPESGAIDQPLLRRWPAAYEDGSYAPSGTNRPNPLVLSEELLKGETGTRSSTGKNALIVFFGQQVVEEILDAQRPACPPEYFNIPIPDNHVYRNQSGHTEMPFLRSRYDQRTGYSPNNPRQQINEITPYLDGGLFYGITKQWSDQLRTYENGTLDPDGCLASSSDGLFPAKNIERLPMANPPPPFYHSTFIKAHETAKVSRFFKLGNPRGNENTFLLSFGIMWFRWHNYLAKRIRKLKPDWSSEKVFNEARKWVIATQQKIVVYDWLEEWTFDKLPVYTKYDPSIDPQIDQFFQSAAFRFGHTLVVPGVYIRDYIRNGCKTKFETWGKNTVRTCNSFWRPHEPIETHINTTSNEFIDIDRILMGMSVQLCEKEDHKIIEDLRGNVFGPLEFPRRDLMAVNIQRGRDHGLPDYNTARVAFGLPKVNFANFSHISVEILKKFEELYKNRIDDIDIWVGGILETTDRPGPLFRTIIMDQFRRIRDGDRFWFENSANGLFNQEEIERIKQISIYDILMAVTKMDENDIPKNPFNVPVMADNILQNNCKLLRSQCKRNTSFNCFHLPPLQNSVLNESCVSGSTYDYFNNSETSYILTFIGIGATIMSFILVIFLLIKWKKNKNIKIKIAENRHTRDTFENKKGICYPLFVVNEWVGYKTPSRRIIIILNNEKKHIEVMCPSGSLFRVIDLSVQSKKIQVYIIKDAPVIIIKTLHDYDLVAKFESLYMQNQFLSAFDSFCMSTTINRENITSLNLTAALKKVVTKADRQKLLERFYRVVFAQAFKIKYPQKELLSIDENFAKEIAHTELTIIEFADAMSMRSNSEFVMRMFSLVDKDKNGFISFREFVDLLVIFANGTEKEKARLLFDMYDINNLGYLTEQNFITMIKSLLATVDGKVEDEKLEQTMKGILNHMGLTHKKQLDFNDFLKMFDTKQLSKARLNFKGVKSVDESSYLEKARFTIENIYESHQEIQERFRGEIGESTSDTSKIIDENQAKLLDGESTRKRPANVILRFIEIKSKEIFWLSLYTFVLLAIFLERAYYYTVEREHSGLRRIAGYGVTITRGAASAMMFTYSSLLVTMCRNTITYLRDTVANKYFPFDSYIEIHKYIAAWAFIFTVMHIVGHAFNFYHISTQTADDLTCLFRNFFHSTHEIPKFHYWCWQTITGFTGVVLTIIWALIYIFAQNIVRRKIYNWFWYTHSLYPLFFIFMILHGTGRLIQPPFFHYFFLGPVILFTIDSLISINRKKMEIPVLRAEVLPSNVTMLEFRKPENFQYKSGQWVQIACLDLNKREYHPFTLSSSPDEDNLTVHIRAVGPWTTHIRLLYDKLNMTKSLLPKLYLDGPFGEGHQDWNLYEVSILIGGGIGVTPFASILKDVVYKSNQTRCKKVYFIWVSRTQKQFEWLVDIIQELEYKDQKNLISCHIFITQFFEKFDLRTVFLYICERHYQRISKRSLFTNLKAVTHFGRPNFKGFFQTVTSIHKDVRSVGVFSCGPPSMTSRVDKACNEACKYKRFEHHFKNF